MNGDVAFDEVNEFLKDSGDIMPPSAVNSTRFYGNESEGDKYIDKYSDQIFQSEGDKYIDKYFDQIRGRQVHKLELLLQLPLC